MALNGTRTLRGALAGAAGAAAWAAQQPLDKRVFGVEYDDVELLGKLFTRGPAWLPVGLAAHVGNGAVFGALYANVAPSLPGPRAACGPARRARRVLRDVARDAAARPRASRPPLTSRHCGATRARSRRRPGGTRCSASSWASSSGG